MSECIFCKIINKEIPAEIVYEDANALGVLDIHPRGPGHTTILPKFHAETIINLPEEKIGSVFKAVRSMVERLNSALRPDGFTIGINHGLAAGQAVPHLHVHIIPRYKNDGGVSLQALVDNPPKESLRSIKEKIVKI